MAKRLFCSVLCVFAFLLATACKNPASPPASKVISVEIAPTTVQVDKGEERQFTATVKVSGKAGKTVKWSLTGKLSSGTTLSDSGLLKVAADETSPELTVTVTSTVDPEKHASAKVTVPQGTVPPEVISITISPKTAIVAKGGEQQFTAEVVVAGGASQEKGWAISGETSNATNINTATGLLKIGADEGSGPITVTVTSKANSAKFDTATVTVLNPLPTPDKPSLDEFGVARWTALPSEANVVSYTVELFKDGNAVVDDNNKKTVNKGTADTYKNDFLSVMRKSAGVYTVKVIANGDNISFTNSLSSAASDSQTVVQRPQAVNLAWNGNSAQWAAGTADTYTAAIGYLVKLYINGSSDSSLEFTVKSLSHDFSEKIDSEENGIYKFTVKVLGDEYLVLGVNEPVQSPDYVILSKVWLVGTMFNNWEFPPGKLMDTDNGTFTWEGEVDANSTFRFSLTDTSTWTDKWNGSWFAPETDGTEITLDNAENDMKLFDTNTSLGATQSTENSWKITAAGWYKFIVNPSTMKLRVERPVEVTSIEKINMPPQVLKEHHYDLTVTLIGKNTDLAQVVWEIAGGHHAGTSFGTGELSNRLTVSIDEAQASLTIKVTVGGITAQSEPVPVKSPDDFGMAVVTLTVGDNGKGLGLVGGLPSDRKIFKTGGTPVTDDQLIFTVNSPNASYTYTWYVDGKKQEPSASSITLKAGELDVGYHTVRLTVLADGVYWSMPDLLGFTVAAVKE